MSAYHFLVIIRCVEAIRAIAIADNEENGENSKIYAPLNEQLGKFDRELRAFVLSFEEIPSRLKAMMRFATENAQTTNRSKLIVNKCAFYEAIGDLIESLS